MTSSEAGEFSDRCFAMVALIVGKFVEKWSPHFAEKMPEEKATAFVRGAVGLSLLTVGVSQLRPIGFTKEDLQKHLDEAWDDWSETPSGSADSRCASIAS